jgi:hypothetical protein
MRQAFARWIGHADSPRLTRIRWQATASKKFRILPMLRWERGCFFWSWFGYRGWVGW